MKKTKVDQAINSQLFSADSKQVLQALNLLKEQGNAEYLPILFDLLLAGCEPEVEQEIVKLLGTIKDKNSIPFFVDALKNEKYVPIRKKITTVCWQNGLDFSEHIETFTDLVITENWETAFEAFTVIENFEHFPAPDVMKPLKLKIAAALKLAQEQKAYLLEELLKLST